MALPRTFGGLLPILAAVALLWPAACSATADELLRVAVGHENESHAIQLAADTVSTWPAGGEQVFLLRGKVLIEQGVFSIRANQAVLWINTAAQQKDRLYRVQIIADGKVDLADGTLRKSGPTLLTDLITRQEVKVRPTAKVIPQPQGNDPFYLRAYSLRPAPPKSAVQLAVATAPATPVQNAIVPVQQTVQAPVPVPVPAPAPAVQLPSVVPGVTDRVVGPAAPGAPPPPGRNIIFQRRTDQPLQINIFPLPTGEKAGVISGGVILSVRDAKGGTLLDIEADRAVIWSHGDTEQLFDRMKAPEGSNAREVEFYLAGHVELRGAGNAIPGTPAAEAAKQRILRAEQVYYDVQRNVAIAVDADLQFRRPGVQDDLHLTADELVQVSPTKFEAVKAHLFASHLPSDPGLQVVMAHATVEDTKIDRRGFFGQTIYDPKTGQPETYIERMVHGENVTFQLEGVPVFYLPVVQGDANDPFGPLHSIGFKQDHIFGTQIYTDFDVWNLLNRNPVVGTRWTADFDYLSSRGPAIGTDFLYGGKDLFGLEGPYVGRVKLFGIYDTGTDVLGGGRGEADHHPDWRGRFLDRHNQMIEDEWTIQGQISVLSDKNFLEQYYKTEFDTDINNETYFYVRQQQDNWAWTAFAKPHIRDWVTEDEWLPRVDGYLLGQSFLDLFTYNLWASAGYAQLRTTSVPPPPWPPEQPTDVNNSTGRFDVSQEISLPFYLGPIRVVPYGVLDFTYYTSSLDGDSDARVYGGGGVRSSLPLSRLYPNVESELFNLEGLYHKIVFSTNYFYARTNDPYTEFPELDRLNDDATDQALRDIYPRQPALNPGAGLALATSPIFDPQLYAIRQLVDDRIDTRSDIDVLQADIRQRWQTKRGYPGQEHIVDFLTLDTSVSFFPEPSQNFGKNFAFLQYDATWNVGDRTALTSTGWYDPYDNGARVFTIGAAMNRPDRTSFYLGLRSIDPVNSQAVITSASYVFSPKYAITASSVYDLATRKSLANSLVVTRIGSDLTMNVGFTYNAILNNFGFTFELLPNLAAATQKPGTSLFGSSGLK